MTREAKDALSVAFEVKWPRITSDHGTDRGWQDRIPHVAHCRHHLPIWIVANNCEFSVFDETISPSIKHEIPNRCTFYLRLAGVAALVS